MDLKGYIDLSIKVLSDWRVLVCTGAVLVIWTLLRYVGVIAPHHPRTYTRPKASPPPPPREEEKD